jgi:uncharacterized membrane protein
MNPRSTVSIAGHPVHAMLVPFVIAFYTGGFLADVTYAYVMDPFWARAAFWLIGAGIVASGAAATIGLIDFLAEPAIRELRDAWWHLCANIALAVVSLLDWLLRYEVGPDAGSRAYIWLSGASVAILLFSGWKGGQLVYRHRVGVRN